MHIAAQIGDDGILPPLPIKSLSFSCSEAFSGDLAGDMAGDDVMGRNKITTQTQQRKYPHWVDIAQSHDAERTPEEYRALSDRLTAMLAWHQQRGLQHQWGRAGISTTRWCFAKASDADAFAEDFGGTRPATP